MFGIRMYPMFIILIQSQIPALIGLCDGSDRMGAFDVSTCVSASAFLLVRISMCCYYSAFCIIGNVATVRVI
jgi:hypothetical protein